MTNYFCFDATEHRLDCSAHDMQMFLYYNDRVRITDIFNSRSFTIVYFSTEFCIRYLAAITDHHNPTTTLWLLNCWNAEEQLIHNGIYSITLRTKIHESRRRLPNKWQLSGRLKFSTREICLRPKRLFCVPSHASMSRDKKNNFFSCLKIQLHSKIVVENIELFG